MLSFLVRISYGFRKERDTRRERFGRTRREISLLRSDRRCCFAKKGRSHTVTHHSTTLVKESFSRMPALQNGGVVPFSFYSHFAFTLHPHPPLPSPHASDACHESITIFFFLLFCILSYPFLCKLSVSTRNEVNFRLCAHAGCRRRF